jgi:arylsulfatase A-like enzyme
MPKFAILLFLLFIGIGRAAQPPNLIIILADDMGYSDLGCYGGEFATPALNRLASEGVRLTRFYNGGMCVVSRAMMLTGKWWPNALPKFSKTRLLSEGLNKANYRTGLIGKWHLEGDPMDRGFDHFYGFLAGFADHFNGAPSYRLDREPYKSFEPNYYSTDAFTERASQFIKSTPADKPFFLYLSYQAPHNPLQAPAKEIAKHRGNYTAGWQAVREARFRRQQEMGIFPASAVLPDAPQNLPKWETLTPAQRDLEDLRMATYAAMVEQMDQGIGRVLQTLREAGREDNTMILFLSDNGADSFSVVDEAMLQQSKLPGDRASNWQLGTGWAYASVTPWRLYKISQHGGGITTGAIAWWPNGGLGKPGRIEATPVHMIDILPTFLDVASATATTPAPGESLLPLLQGKAHSRKAPLYFQYLDNRAIRTADWTLVEVDGAGWELYQPSTDFFENNNLASAKPQIVADLSAQWNTWWRQESGKPTYAPEPARGSQHYKPQGDRGSGVPYQPSAMPSNLADRIPLPVSTKSNP